MKRWWNVTVAELEDAVMTACIVVAVGSVGLACAFIRATDGPPGCSSSWCSGAMQCRGGACVPLDGARAADAGG